jgi:hypothetical protein
MRQVIVLSHYEQDIAKFLNTYHNNNRPITFIAIEREAGTSTLKKADIAHFIRNEHEKTRENIFRFILGQQNSHNSSDLRIFLEFEINYRFAKQIKVYNIDEYNLKDRINKLLEKNIITEQVAKDAHNWRETLNPSHHIWINNDVEDQRNTATQLVEFIYHQLIPHYAGN